VLRPNERRENGSVGRAGFGRASDAITFWDYENGLFFAFQGAPTFGTVRVPLHYQEYVREIEHANPSRWDNVLPGRVHEMPVRMARFRGAVDSVELYLASLAPINAIHEAAGTTVRIDGSFWLFNERDSRAERDSTRFGNDGAKVWFRTLPPGNYLYRVEATADGVSDAARAMGWVRATDDPTTGFSTRGFGMSDVLVTSRAEARGSPARWTDFDVVPALAPIARNGVVALIWEAYDFGARDGQSQFEVSLTVERQRTAAGRITTEVIGALASLVGVQRGDDRVTHTWTRTVPHTPVFVDHVSVALRDTPAGTYVVTVQITDSVSGRKTSRASVITVRE
jgi:hypothetical protein